MIIDAHQHFWRLSEPFDYDWIKTPKHAAINRDFLPDDLAPLLKESGVQKTVFVQTQHDLQENRWVLQMASEHDFIAGVVGWVDLASANCEEQLAEFCDDPKFVGVRHITHDEPDDDFIIRPDVLQGLKVLEEQNVPFDLLFFPRHLKHATTLAKQFPDLRMVIDHLAKPNIRDGQTDNWLEPFRAAADYPNIYCKISGMVTEADWQSWQPADLRPYIETALEAFTPKRCMFGSDWPVCELAGTYNEVIEAVRETVGEISANEQAAIFGETAIELYGLKV